MEVLLVPGLVALAVLAGSSVLWVERRRRQALQALAQQRGWQLVGRDDVWARAFEGEPFGWGSHRRAEHVLTGSCGGRDLVAFDYSFRTKSADGSGQVRTYRYGVVVLRLPVPVPLVELEASRLPRLFRRGIELESEEFNARYRVRADDARLAYDVLPPRTMQLLLERPDLSLRLLGGDALSWRPGRLEAADLARRLETMTAVLDAVPAWVWEDRA